MLLETLFAAALLSSSPDAGVQKPRPTARTLASPKAAADAGVVRAEAPDGGLLRSTGQRAAALDGGAGDGGTATPPAPEEAALSPEVKTLVDRMQAFYETTTDFRARFTQRYAYKASKRVQTSTGTVVFKKPGLMRWEYEKPAKKTFVLAGDTIYAHDPEAMLLTVAAINTNQLSASVTFLFGKGKLADEFSIKEVACDKCLGAPLELTPLTPDPRFQKVKLEVDRKTAQVVRSVVIDPDGSENAITFHDLKANTGVGADHFKLDPPQGTQVQDFRKK